MILNLKLDILAIAESHCKNNNDLSLNLGLNGVEIIEKYCMLKLGQDQGM